MEAEVFAYPLALKGALFMVFSSSLLLIVIAILSAKSLGGRLGHGLKKIAAGAILNAAMFVLLLLLDQGWETVLNSEYLRIFFIVITVFATALLIWGFYQIYKISKELKLFY